MGLNTQVTRQQIINDAWKVGRYRYRRSRVAEPEPPGLFWLEPEPGFLAGARARFFWLEPEPDVFGWSWSQAFLAGAGARLFWLEPEPGFSGWSRSQAFLAGARARLFWLEPEPEPKKK